MKGPPSHWTTLRRLIYLRALLAGSGAETLTVTGVSPLALLNAVAHSLVSLTQYGKCTQNGTPTPTSPVGINCNNGALRYGAVGKNLVNIKTADMAQGSISSSNGANSNSTYRVRTIGYYPVKPNTQYTLSCVIDGYTSGSSRGVFLLEYATEDVSGYTGDSSGWKSPDGYTFTTGASTNFIRIVFARGSSSSTPIIPEDVTNVQLEYGETATAYEPFVGGIYADGTPEVLTVQGINLFDKNTMDTGQGYYVNTGGNIVNGYNANRTVWIPCKPNTKYSYWHTEGAGGCCAFAMNKDTIDTSDTSEWLKGSPAYLGKNVVSTVTTPADAVKLYITAARSNLDPERSFDEQLADFMVVEGDISTATPYQPYSAPQTVNDVSNLLAVGDYADTEELVHGLLTHKVGVKVLDGTEDWGQNTTYKRFTTQFPNMASAPPRSLPFWSTHFVTAYSATTEAGYIYNGANNTTVMITHDAADVTAFKAWLVAQYAAGTPVMVIYPLAEETTESTTPHSLHTVAGTNTVTVESNVDPVTLAVEYKGLTA